MPRTTGPEVIAVLRNGTEGGDYDDVNSPSLDPFIAWAGLIVDEVYQCSVRKGKPYSTELLANLETWLASHAYATSDRVYTQRSTLRAAGSFGGQLDKYLEFTPYGQMAKLLDNLGCLESLGKKKSVGAYWLGRRPSQQTDYEDRT